MRALHNLLNVRWLRIGLIVLCDMVVVVAAYFIAFWLRIDLVEAESYAIYGNRYFLATLPWLLVVRIGGNAVFRLYSWSFSHAGFAEGVRLASSVAAGTAVYVVLGHVLRVLGHPPPRSIYALEAALTFSGMYILRFFPGYLLLLSAQRMQMRAANNEAAVRTVIYGNGGSNEALARELLRTHGHNCVLIGLVDDNPAHLNSSMHGVTVLGGREALPKIIEQFRVEQLILAGDNFPGQVVRDLVDTCGPRRVRLKSIPVYSNLFKSSRTVPAIKDIDPAALLDRQPVDFSSVDIKGFFQGKIVLVTGAGGTIGSELCRQIMGFGAKRLLLFDIDENALFFLEMDIRKQFPACDAVLILGSVRDRARLDEVMELYRPEVVFHAAAHKHVPIVEQAPGEAIKNNVVGTYEVANSACAYGVSRFILVSTDKAAARTNVLGSSKWLAELMVRKLNARGRTRFQVVRFGNVLDSSGSLVEVVRRQIARGLPVTITHQDMERYFMTIPEAVGLILVAAVLGEGDINVLDMGTPIKIDNLVRQMIYLSGLVPDQDVPIHYAHPRPGERLTEMMYDRDEKVYPSSFSRINIASGSHAAIDVERMIEDARLVVSVSDAENFWRRWIRP